MGYYAAIRIRDAEITVGKETKRNFIIHKRDKTNYAVPDYIQMIQLLENEKGGFSGNLIEWKEVRVADNCVQTILEIHALTNVAHQVTEGNSTPLIMPKRRKDENQETIEKMKYVRLLIIAEICPRAKRD